jgi:hypothetical protein
MNKFCINQTVLFEGVEYIVDDILDDGFYDLREKNGDGEMRNIPEFAIEAI